MAYADQQMSGNKITALIVVAILHVLVGYALVTGLAYEAYKKVKEVTSAVNIEEEKPPEDAAAAPPKQDTPPPPIVAPPPPITFNAPAQPQIETVSTPPPPAPVFVTPAPPPPPPPPPPQVPAEGCCSQGQSRQTGRRRTTILRAHCVKSVKARTGFRVTVGTDGKVTDCQVTRSSGSPDLDQATCDNIRRRARFTPATDGDGNPTTGSYSSSIRWVIPKD